MAQLTLVLGNSGTGKSYSLRSFTKKDGIGYITATGKPLPFKNDIPQFHAKNYAELEAAIEKSTAEVVVIDDFNYFMSYEEFSYATTKGYEKFTLMAVNVVNIFEKITKKDTNQRFYILAHSEDDEEGRLRLKTTGKMVRDKFVPEGLTNQVIETEVDGDNFFFRVKTDGRGVKTPIGMFNSETIDNDLKLVDNAIKKYYN